MLLLGKGNQSMKPRVATDRIRPMARPHSMCENCPPIDERKCCPAETKGRHFPPPVLIFKMIIIGASGIRRQTIVSTLSISHTWCPQSETNWLHKQSCEQSLKVWFWSVLAACGGADWQSAKPSVLPRSRYIFSHFRRFLRACFFTKPHNLSSLSWIWDTFAFKFATAYQTQKALGTWLWHFLLWPVLH